MLMRHALSRSNEHRYFVYQKKSGKIIFFKNSLENTLNYLERHYHFFPKVFIIHFTGFLKKLILASCMFSGWTLIHTDGIGLHQLSV